MADAPRERVELLTGWSRTAPTAARSITGSYFSHNVYESVTST